MDRSITLIPVIPEDEIIESSGTTHIRKKRVGAYCRVSTDQDQQLNSLEAQCRYFQNLIESKDEWEMAGIYA